MRLNMNEIEEMSTVVEKARKYDMLCKTLFSTAKLSADIESGNKKGFLYFSGSELGKFMRQNEHKWYWNTYNNLKDSEGRR